MSLLSTITRTKRKLMLGYPQTLQIQLETMCNLHCFFCLYDGRGDRPHSFDVSNLDKLDTAIKNAEVISISSWGEPLLSPNFNRVLDKVFKLNPKKELLSIVTNGTLLGPVVAEKLDGRIAGLAISLNASNEATFKRDMRGGNWHTLMQNIRSFVASTKDKSKISLHMVAHSQSYQEIPELVEMASRLGISNVRVDQFMVSKKEYLPLSLINVKAEYNFIIEVAQELAKQLGINFIARTFGTETKRQECLSPWLESYILCDGRVAPCCYTGNYFMGNAFEDGFEPIWFGDEYNSLRYKPAKQCLTCPKILPFDDERAHILPLLQETM